MDLPVEMREPPFWFRQIRSSSASEIPYHCPCVALHFSRAALHDKYFVPLVEHPALPETATCAAELWTESFFYFTVTAKKLICHDLPIHFGVKPGVKEEII